MSNEVTLRIGITMVFVTMDSLLCHDIRKMNVKRFIRVFAKDLCLTR